MKDYSFNTARPPVPIGSSWPASTAIISGYVATGSIRSTPSALRVTVLATNGDPQARIFEIRCYG